MSDRSGKNHGLEIRHIDRIVGVFIMGAIVIGVASWFLRQQGLGEFEEELPFYTIVSKSYGLVADGEINLAGVTIGTISNVTLQDDGKVRVEMGFIERDRKFLTVGSQLEVESAIGVQSLLGGGGLIFNYNPNSTVLLDLNTELTTVEPLDLAAQIEAFDLPGLAEQVKSIVYNVEEITRALKDDQGALFGTLDNVNKITLDLAESTKVFPKLMDDIAQQIPQALGEVEQVVKNVEVLTHRLEAEQVPAILGSVENNLSSLQTAMDSVSGILTDSEDNIKQVMANAAGATDELNKATADLNALLVDLQGIVKDVGASSKQLPGVLARSEDLLDNSVELTDKLNNHWLLGGKGEGNQPSQPWPSIHSIGESPYDEAP